MNVSKNNNNDYQTLPYLKRVSSSQSHRNQTAKFEGKKINFYEEKPEKTPFLKCIYSYGEQKSDVEKTPMCQIAEIARFNKVNSKFRIL